MNLKNHRKLLIGTAIATAVAVGAVSVNAFAGTVIHTASISSGQLECELELNGKVESLTEKKYFANIGGVIGSVNVKEGDLVKKGDLMISYDMEDIELETTLTELDAQADQGGYDDSKQTGGRIAGLYGEAKNSIAALDSQITTTEAVIIMTQKALTDRKSELSARGAQLQADLAGCVPDEDDDPEEVEKARQHIQEEIARNTHDQQYDPEIVKKQEELDYLNYLMASYKEKRSVMESQKASTQLNLQTKGAKDQLEAVKAADDLVNESKLQDYSEAMDGVRADFDGIVTKLSVSEGSYVSSGQELVQIQSLDDVAVVCYVNKYDITDIEEGQSASAHIKNKDYTCSVTRIEKKTSEDADTPGIRVELAVDEPDDSIILGIESKVKVNTAMLAYALLVPTDALCSDDEGDYVFVINENRAELRRVTVGARNDDMAEVCEGLSAGEIVGWDETSELTNGQKVKVR
ncbi:MAG: efflux RND transporter periplasmic adaptor subunit [Lachnospiraceae bacterium]|nr:efflux RND transporter periplasmic adaptor subunit [Lachnospiraceae bacterium]